MCMWHVFHICTILYYCSSTAYTSYRGKKEKNKKGFALKACCVVARHRGIFEKETSFSNFLRLFFGIWDNLEIITESMNGNID